MRCIGPKGTQNIALLAFSSRKCDGMVWALCTYKISCDCSFQLLLCCSVWMSVAVLTLSMPTFL